MVIFGTYDASDWGIVTGVSIGTPPVKTAYVDIPGGNGSLDFSEALGGGPVYGMREIMVEITVIKKSSLASYFAVYSAIYAALHGKRMNFYFDELFPGWHFVGRCSVGAEQEYKSYGVVTVGVTAEPYMLKDTETTVSRSGSGTMTLTNSGMPVTPTVSVSGSTTITWSGNSVTLAAGNNQIIPALRLGAGETVTLTVTTSGTTTIKWTEGKL